jgi:prolyl-tRNA synthetase
MGSYGIGVTRILAVIAEANNDEKGLIWPREVAPFDVHVIATGKDEVAYELAEKVCADLERVGLEVGGLGRAGLGKAGLDILYDDRPKVSPGVKFGDAELLGVPTIVIVGRGAADGVVELWDRRSGDRRELPAAELAAQLAAELGTAR